MLDIRFFDRDRTEEEEDELNRIFNICFWLLVLVTSSISLFNSIRARLRLQRTIEAVGQTMPDLRFASQLYIREHASEQERAAFLASKGKKGLYR